MAIAFGYDAQLAALRAEEPSGTRWLTLLFLFLRLAFGPNTKFTHTSKFSTFSDGSLESDAYAVVLRDKDGKIPKSAIKGGALKFIDTENLPNLGNGTRVSRVKPGYRIQGDTVILTWQNQMVEIAGTGSPDECTGGQVWDPDAGQCIDPDAPNP